jgi:hypothetical protein
VCGKTVFLKFVGEREADGGYTKWREYEDIPDGWMMNVHVGDIWLKNVCPECGELLRKSLAEAIGKIMANYA